MSMDARVGSARSDHMDGVIEKLGKGTLEFTLYSRKLGLDLPSVENSAIISERELEVPHGIRL